MAVYLDLVVLLNFLVDFLLLLGTNRLGGYPEGTVRCAGAAGLGGVYSGACLLPGFGFLGNWLWRCVMLGVMAVTAFGWNRSTVRRGGVFVLLSMALGGIAISFGRGEFLPLLAAAAGCWGLCRVAFGGQVGGKTYVPVTVCYGGRKADFLALKDTGNTLRDPVSGERVLVIAGEVACNLTGLTREQLGMPLETLEKRPMPGLRLIPYRAVGERGGMMLGMRMEDVIIGQEKRSAVVAFAAEGLGEGEVYQGLMFGE